MTVLYIIIAILIFGVLIAVHELGHFTAAKVCGVKVEEFAIGMGPAIIKKQRGETLYSLRCVPMGGFCAMAGEDEESNDPRAFTNQPVWKRAVILVAGAFMNFVFGLLVVLLLYSNAEAFRAPVLEGFMDGCPYNSAQGLQAGDRFYSIDGHRIYQYYDVADFLGQGDGVHDIVLKRGEEKVRLDGFKIVPVEYEGYENKMYGFYLGYDRATPGVKLSHAWNTCMEFGRWVWTGLRQLVSGQVGMKDMAGPVGIVDMMAQTGGQAASVKDALYDIFYLGAFIAVNLALMNMLPIPALDGGRVFCLIITWIIETVSRKKLNPKYEGYIHAAGMTLLLGLMAVILLNDIIRIVTK